MKRRNAGDVSWEMFVCWEESTLRVMWFCVTLWALCVVARTTVAGEHEIDVSSPFPYGLACDGSTLWCVDFRSDSLLAIELQTGKTRVCAQLTAKAPAGLCCADDALWVVAGGAICQLDPLSGSCEPWLELKDGIPTGLASDGQLFYVADREKRLIRCIDMATRKTVRTIPVPGRWPRGMTFHDGSLWLVDSADRAVYRLDPETGDVLSAFVAPEGEPRGVVWVNGKWWFTMIRPSRLVGTPVESLGSEVPGNAMRSNPIHVRVTFMDTVENHSPKAVRDVTFRMAVPPETARQQIKSLTFEPQPAEIREDRFGQKIAFFHFPEIQAGVKKTVQWTADAVLWAIRYTPAEGADGDQRPIPEQLLAEFTNDDRVIGLELPEIKRAAEQAANGTDGMLSLVTQLRDYVMSRVKYVRDNRWDPAVTVLEKGQGSCSEYSYLFTALARANGVPVRFVGATAYRPPEAGNNDGNEGDGSGSGIYEDRVFHRWVEVYVPPYGWLPIDVNRDDRQSPPFPRRYLFALTEKLLVLSKTNWGDQANLNADYRSYHTWNRGENNEKECQVKTRRVARWERLPLPSTEGVHAP